MARVVFMGTPDFAVPTLNVLAQRHEVVTVITQQDRRGGRGRHLRPPPAKEAAQQLGLPVWQPGTLRTPQAVARLRQLASDVVVVAAFGQILSSEVLSIPPHGCVNVHASLLPKYRGAEPVVAAILAGDEETGVTIMLIEERLDSGPMLAQRAISITPHDTRASLTGRLAEEGAQLLLDVLPLWLAGEIAPQPQDDASASYAPLLSKGDGEINWSQPATTIERMTRAYDPWPGAYTQWQGSQLKILRARSVPKLQGEPGTVAAVEEGVAVSAGEGALLLDEIQPAGRRPMRAADFVRGRREFVGSRLPS